MTREELIKAIDNDLELCPDHSCDLPEKENNTGDCCRKCAEKQLAEYEAKIRADERQKTIDEHALEVTLIEKQIPQKPIYQADGYYDGELVYDTWFCPNCDTAYEADIDEYNYCPNCGQAIDWSEEGEQNGE